MENLLQAIHAAIAPDATDEVRATGAVACRTIASALETKAGEPLADPSVMMPNANTIAAAISSLRTIPPDQLLDLAIARLRAALPAEAAMPPVQPVKFHVVQMPSALPTKSKR